MEQARARLHSREQLIRPLAKVFRGIVINYETTQGFTLGLFHSLAFSFGN